MIEPWGWGNGDWFAFCRTAPFSGVAAANLIIWHGRERPLWKYSAVQGDRRLCAAIGQAS
jgi:hypothetical protein